MNYGSLLFLRICYSISSRLNYIANSTSLVSLGPNSPGVSFWFWEYMTSMGGCVTIDLTGIIIALGVAIVDVEG